MVQDAPPLIFVCGLLGLPWRETVQEGVQNFAPVELRSLRDSPWSIVRFLPCRWESFASKATSRPAPWRPTYLLGSDARPLKLLGSSLRCWPDRALRHLQGSWLSGGLQNWCPNCCCWRSLEGKRQADKCDLHRGLPLLQDLLLAGGRPYGDIAPFFCGVLRGLASDGVQLLVISLVVKLSAVQKKRLSWSLDRHFRAQGSQSDTGEFQDSLLLRLCWFVGILTFIVALHCFRTFNSLVGTLKVKHERCDCTVTLAPLCAFSC